jgi:hypothetical protein
MSVDWPAAATGNAAGWTRTEGAPMRRTWAHHAARLGQSVAMPDIYPTVTLDLWRSDAIVLFDWLKRTNLSAVPTDHPAVKQALTDLLSLLESSDVNSVTQDEIDHARSEVAKDMGW